MIIHTPQELAIIIKDRRKSQKLSQNDVGNPVGLKQTTVSAFERKPESTKLDTLFRILATTNLQIHLHPRDKSSNTSDEGW